MMVFVFGGLLFFQSVWTGFVKSVRKHRSMLKGKAGEWLVSNLGLGQLDNNVYATLNNVVIPRPDGGGTTQIDHVVISQFGIFVIETKNYSGWIFARAKDRQWTQVIKGGKKSRFQNPLHQNALHVRALANHLHLPREVFVPIVYFCGDAQFKNGAPPGVVQSGLVPIIQSHFRHRLDLPTVHNAILTLLSAKGTTHQLPSGDRQHVGASRNRIR